MDPVKGFWPELLNQDICSLCFFYPSADNAAMNVWLIGATLMGAYCIPPGCILM